eukprot:6992918-Pyramimonas_sp.AAC.1
MRRVIRVRQACRVLQSRQVRNVRDRRRERAWCACARVRTHRETCRPPPPLPRRRVVGYSQDPRQGDPVVVGSRGPSIGQNH